MCRMCAAPKNLRVHHSDYKIHGYEIEETQGNYLITLCHDCHRLYHGKVRLRPSEETVTILDIVPTLSSALGFLEKGNFEIATVKLKRFIPNLIDLSSAEINSIVHGWDHRPRSEAELLVAATQQQAEEDDDFYDLPNPGWRKRPKLETGKNIAEQIEKANNSTITQND
jgi:hypothetical protein